MQLKAIFMSCLSSKKNTLDEPNNIDYNKYSYTTLNIKNTVRQVNPSMLNCNINQISIKPNGFLESNIDNKSGENSVKTNKFSKSEATVKEFRKKIIFENGNLDQGSLHSLQVSLQIEKQSYKRKKNNLNKKKIVFSFNSTKKSNINNLQSSDFISNSMLDLKSQSNYKTKPPGFRSAKNDNVILHFNNHHKANQS